MNVEALERNKKQNDDAKSHYANVSMSHYSNIDDAFKPEYKDVFVGDDELQRMNAEVLGE